MKRAAKHNVYPWKISCVLREKCHTCSVDILCRKFISYWQLSWLKQKKIIKPYTHFLLTISQLKKQWKQNHVIFHYEWNSLSGWEIQMHWYLGGHIQIAPFGMIRNTCPQSLFFEWCLRIQKTWFHKTKYHW